MNIGQTSSIRESAVDFVYSLLLNTYLVELNAGERLAKLPQRDATLRNKLQETGARQWIHVELDKRSLYIPTEYSSITGRHKYRFPILCATKDKLTDVSIYEFIRFIFEALQLHAECKDLCFRVRVESCIRNLASILELRQGDRITAIHSAYASFIETEQALLLGHAMHPLAKDRSGFTDEDLQRYSPEFERSFQLHYFLCAPQLFEEQHVGVSSPSGAFREAAAGASSMPAAVLDLLTKHSDWKLIPLHPWEAKFQLSEDSTRKLLVQGLLLDLGQFGSLFHATSSLRTVWSPEFPFMLKFSLHAKLTNSVRINHPWELPIGISITRLLRTEWGKGIALEFPEIEFIHDPAYYTIRASEDGEFIDGFSTIVRHNPFVAGTSGNIALLASLCQDGIDGNPSRLANIVTTDAMARGISIGESSALWFERYLAVFLHPLIQIYSRYGLALEAHQQNILLALDARGFPTRSYFRDNQGYFIREGKRREVERHVPDFGKDCFLVHSEEHINPKFTYYLIINNLVGVISAMGREGIAKETDLIKLAEHCLESMRPDDESGLISHILDSAFWTIKGNLSMSVADMNEATQPIERPAVYLPYPNPFLIGRHLSRRITAPSPGEIVRSRYVEEHDLTLSLRLFDQARDLPTYHHWFHQDYAQTFWKMADSIEALDVSYNAQQSSLHSRAYTGLRDGEPEFAVEFYWAPRDLVGRYYDVQPGDYGLHLLIAPPEVPKRNFSLHVLFLCLDFLFSDPRVRRVICEADRRNMAMDHLLQRAGFRSLGIIQLPEKEAHLTCCTRESFHEKQCALHAATYLASGPSAVA